MSKRETSRSGTKAGSKAGTKAGSKAGTKAGSTASPKAGSTASTTALDVVRADPTPVEQRRRRRMILKSVIITFVLTFGWIGVMVGLQKMSTTAYNFRDETTRVLELIRDGKAIKVYREASPLLQETMIAERFSELASDIRGTLGGFREIAAIKQAEAIDGPGGKTGRARATLIFDRGKTTAHFSYHWNDGKWRLLGFDISIPEALKDEVASRAELRSVRVEASAEVHALARHILERVRDGDSAAVYDESAPTFQQSINRETFLEIQDQRRRALGKYVRILDTLQSWRNRSRSKAHVSFVVQYEKAKTSVTIGFLKIEDEWKLTYYKVVMPKPRIPLAADTNP